MDQAIILTDKRLCKEDIEKLSLKIENNKISFISIAYCDLSKLDLTSFCQAIAKSSKVKILHLTDCNLTDKQELQLLGAIKVNKSMEEIVFSFSNGLSEEFYVDLANILKTNNKLKTVKAVQSKYNYDLEKLANIYADSLSYNKTLKNCVILDSTTTNDNELSKSIILYNNDGTAGIVKFFLEKAFENSSVYLPSYKSIRKYLNYFNKFTQDVQKASAQSFIDKMLDSNKPDLTSLDIVFKYIADVGLFRALGVTKHNFQKGPLELNLTYNDGSESNARISKDVMDLISTFYADPNVTSESFAIEDSTDLIGDND